MISIKSEKEDSELIEELKVEARNILRAAIARQGVSYKELSRRLEQVGEQYSDRVLSTKVSRGKFSFAFFLLCMRVLGVDSIDLTNPGKVRNQNRL